MTEHGPELSDALQLLLDGRLTAERRALVEAHLADCERCRRELEALRRVKHVIRASLTHDQEPPELAERIAAALAAHDASRRDAARRGRRVPGSAIAGLALAAAAVLAVVLMRRSQPDVVAAAAADLAQYRPGAVQLATDDPRALERFFVARGLPFTTRVFDFGMMGYRLTGGAVHRLAGRVSARFAYEDGAGRKILCQMYEGLLTELPAAGEEREHNGIRFRIYRVAAGTLVFWQEGSVVCVLAADGDAEAAIQLAYAKAIKV